jgi:hypothetical protein
MKLEKTIAELNKPVEVEKEEPEKLGYQCGHCNEGELMLDGYELYCTSCNYNRTPYEYLEQYLRYVLQVEEI